MESDRPHSLRDLVRTIAPGPLLGLRAGLPTTGDDGSHFVGQFEDRLWNLRLDDDALPTLPAELLEAVNKEPDSVVFVDATVPFARQHRPRIALNTPRGTQRDGAAVVYQTLTQLPPGTNVVFLAISALVTLRSFEAIRAEISEAHALRWLVFSDGRLLNAPNSPVKAVLLGCKCSSHSDGVIRLANLVACEEADWSAQVSAAAKRGGGEVGHSVVLRNTRLGTEPWTYERFTKAHQISRQDSSKLGELRPLSELVENMAAGVHLSRFGLKLEPVGDEVEAPPGMIPVLGAREIRPYEIGSVGRFWAEKSLVPEHLLVRPGDVLLRTISVPTPCGPELVAAVVPRALQATFQGNVLRLRWRPEVPEHARELLLSWLMSDRASEALKALGCGLQIAPASLSKLEVPHPSETLIRALGDLSEIERWYDERARAVRQARQAVFDTPSYSEAVPLLLSTQQAEGERVKAADDSQRFEYRVRNYYPHPLALRFERLSIGSHGQSRLEETLECAEHLLHYLAAVSLVQLSAIHPSNPIASRQLSSRLQTGALRFDWGTSLSVLNEAVSATLTSEDPLGLPCPQLVQLRQLVAGDDSPLAVSERVLREQRNSQAHLHRIPEHQLETRSRELTQALVQILEAVIFLADVPLVFVTDYVRDELSGQRWATFEYLRGATVVFERRTVPVAHELPRGALGLLGHDGTFYSLTPWVILHACELCKRPEVFIFNRHEKDVVTYVAMESGHPLSSSPMAQLLDLITASHSER